MSSTLPTTLGPAPIAYRISVAAGVSETIFFGWALIVTAVPSSSVMAAGNAGAVGLGLGASVTAAVETGVAGAAVGLGEAPAPVQPAANRSARSIAGTAVPGRRTTMGRMWCLTLSLEGRASTAGSATGLPAHPGAGHRSGTVPESHRLRDIAA